MVSMSWIKRKIEDITSVDIKHRILWWIKDLNQKIFKEPDVQYRKMLSTAEYFSSSFPVEKEIVCKIEILNSFNRT